MDVTDDYTAQNLSARQRDVMNLIVRGLSNKEIASILNLAEGLTRLRKSISASTLIPDRLTFGMVISGWKTK